MLRMRPALVALALLAAPSALQAQDDRLFRDTWFWGVRGGVTTIATTLPQQTTTVAPSIGGDWVITRTRAGLYVSGDYVLFDVNSGYNDRMATTTGGVRNVRVRNMAKVGIGLLAYPKAFGTIRPYVGGGISILLAGATSTDSTSLDPTVARSVRDTINARKTMAGPSLVLGAQMQIGRLNPYAQVGVDFASETFILGAQTAPVAQFGVRYALAPARERMAVKAVGGRR